MIKKEGKIPVNARVDVDYTGKTPKIDFGYIDKNPKKEAVAQNKMGWIVLSGFLIMMIWAFFPHPVDIPKSCVISQESDKQGGIEYYKFDCDNGEIYYSFFDNSNSYFNGAGFYFSTIKTNPNFWRKMLIFPLLIILLFIIELIVAKWLVRQPWYVKWIPKKRAGGKNKRKKYMKFTPDNLEENVAVIPQFCNVELEYATKGDFSEQLTHIKIREYKHYKYKKQKVGKLKVDNMTWYAVFYFKNKPKDGHLEVFYQ